MDTTDTPRPAGVWRKSLFAVWRALAPPKTARRRRGAVWAVHILSAALLLGPWGVWLMLPINTFGTGLAYHTMAAIASESVWGAGFSLIGMLLYAGSVLGHRHVQVFAAGAATLAFALIASTLLWGNPYGAGWLTFSIPAAANYWALRKLIVPRQVE